MTSKPYFVMFNSDALIAGYFASRIEAISLVGEEGLSYGWSIFRREPSGHVIYIGSDGGEPEDQLLVRDWSWVVDALNAEADRLAFLDGAGKDPA